MITVTEAIEGVILLMWCQGKTRDNQFRSLHHGTDKALSTVPRLRPHKNQVELLLFSWHCAPSHKSGHAWGILGGLYNRIHPLFLIWLNLIFIFFAHLKMHSVWRILKLMRVWFNQWKNIFVIGTKPSSGKAYVHLCRADVKLYKNNRDSVE